MEAIYFGNIKVWGSGSRQRPLDHGRPGERPVLRSPTRGSNASDPTINYRFTTAMVKGGANQWAIRGGNAQSGSLSTFYSGPRPNVSGYNPMHKQGAIILGIGGDNSNGAAGTFYEGAMTSGYPSDATENAVQANIIAAGYGCRQRRRKRHRFIARGGCEQVPRRSERDHDARHAAADLGLQRSDEPDLDPHLLEPADPDRLGHHAVPGRQRPGNHAGTKVIVWSCNGQANQQWTFNSNGTITGAQSGLCLDVTGASTADGALVELWTCNGGSNQQWTLSRRPETALSPAPTTVRAAESLSRSARRAAERR